MMRLPRFLVDISCSVYPARAERLVGARRVETISRLQQCAADRGCRGDRGRVAGAALRGTVNDQDRVAAVKPLLAAPAPLFGGNVIQRGKFLPIADGSSDHDQDKPVRDGNLDAIYNVSLAVVVRWIAAQRCCSRVGWWMPTRAFPRNSNCCSKESAITRWRPKAAIRCVPMLPRIFSGPEPESSGYRVMTHCLAVTTGKYAALLSYAEGGKRLICERTLPSR